MAQNVFSPVNMYCKLLLINFALWVIIISVVWHFVAKFW